MADDTTAVAPPQWTPPPTVGPDPLAAQIQQDQNPQNELQALENNTPPPTPEQAQQQQAQQVQFNELENLQNARDRLASVPQPDYTPTPRDVSDHMTGIKGILHNVSSFLAGPTEYKAIVNPDGSMSISQQPSTEKEKWARIAAAAIGGAAKGLAAGQGPGGAGKAISAGANFGFQIPQQQEQQAQQQVDFNNKQMLNTANRIHLTQQAFLTSQTIAQNKINLGKENSDMLNRIWDATRTSPNAQDLGTLDPTDPNALPRLAKQNPAAMDAFLGKSNMVLQTMPTPDGKFHLVLTDKSYANSKPTEPMELLSAGTKDGEIALNSTMVPAGSNITRQDIWNANLKAVTQVSTAKKNQADADSKDNPQTKAPTTYESGIIQEELAKTPNDRAGALDRAGKRIEAHERRLGGGGAGGAGEGGAPNLGVASPENDTQRNAALAKLAPGDAATVRAIGEIRNAPPNRSTKEGQRLMGLVNQIYPDYDSTQYPAYLKTKLDYTPAGVSGKGLNFIGTALTHMDRMETNIGALKNVTIPVVGSWWNAAKNAATKGTNPGLAAFMDDQKAVTSEIARAYNGGAITQGERDHMESLIDATDSPATIQSAIGEFRQLLQGKLEQYQQGWDAQMPHHQRNAVLDNLVTRGTDYRPPPPATPTPPPGGATNPQPIRPANVPQGFVHSRTGPRGSGWYKPGTPGITPE